MTEGEPRQEEQVPLPRTREVVDWWLARWGRAEPLTRQDVERLIAANGSTAEGLFLARRNLQGAQILKMDLRDANLQSADLIRTDFQGALMIDANL